MTTKKKKADKQKNLLLRISDFRSLFELPDDLRKDRPGPLSYTKSFVSLSGLSKEPEIRHFERLEILKSRSDRHLLRSCFEDLKNWSGKKTIKHRGYLLTTDEQPAGFEYLAAQLRLSVDDLRESIPVLLEIGLIEQVPLDAWKNGYDNKIKTSKKRVKSNHKKNKNSKRKTKTKSGKNKIPDTSGCIRMKTDEIEIPLKNGKRKNKHKNKYNDKNGNGKLQKKIKNGKTNRKHKANAQKEREHEGRTSTAPTTAPPLLPRQSDEGGSVIPFTGPPGSAKNNRGAQRLGDIVQGMIHRYNQDAKQFAADVYRALKLPWDPESAQGRRELGCFASVWMKAKQSGLSAVSLDDLRRRAIQEAVKIAKRPGKCGKVSAVWCSVFNKILAARFQEKQNRAM